MSLFEQKRKHVTHCVYEFSLDRGSRHSEFHPEGEAGRLCARLAELFFFYAMSS